MKSQPGPSLRDLAVRLVDQTRQLVRLEIRLAKAETRQSVTRLGTDAGLVAGGGIVAYTALLALGTGIIILLAGVLPAWLAALLIGLAAIAGGYVLVGMGLRGLRPADTLAQPAAEPPPIQREERRPPVPVGANSARRVRLAISGTDEAQAVAPSSFTRYEPDFRRHYEMSFLEPDSSYGDYLPAYYLGYRLAINPRHAQRDWPALEPTARRAWEQGHPGSWEQVEVAVRYAWEQARRG